MLQDGGADLPPPLLPRAGPVDRRGSAPVGLPPVGEAEQSRQVRELIDVTGGALSEARARAALERYAWNSQVAAAHFFDGELAEVPEPAPPTPPAARTEPQRPAVHSRSPGAPPAGERPPDGDIESSVAQVQAVLKDADPDVVRQLLADCGGDAEQVLRQMLFFEQEEPSFLQDWYQLERQQPAPPLGTVSLQPDDADPAYLAQKAPARVTCNVYNLAPEHTLEKMALGLYHSGIEVYGREWSFGGQSDPEYAEMSGIFWVPPGSAADNLMKKIDLGETSLSPQEMLDLVKRVQPEWKIGSYHILQRNCNHFASAFAQELKVKKPPGWINRAARVGNTLVPNRVVNYFLSQGAPPPEAAAPPAPPPAQSEERGAKKKSRGISGWLPWKKDSDDASESDSGGVPAPLQVGSTVTIPIDSVLSSRDTGHAAPVRGVQAPWGVVRALPAPGTDTATVEFPPQTFIETGSNREVTLGPFMAAVLPSLLQVDTTARQPISTPHPRADAAAAASGRYTDPSAGGGRRGGRAQRSDAAEAAEVQVAAELQEILPHLDLGVIVAALRRHRGDREAALGALLQ
eukprot:TRINITY_DN10950_c0_g1_i1.p1 TRINITY_DN10950_c0_g1~~TRINITY_DN10950_c0_g1_i1.p1  ORF type:complete len:599 (+),score=187.69 TRINITY_DN10950_c0_g1_i1:78-1799(+)